MYHSVNTLRVIESYTLNGSLSCHVTDISIQQLGERAAEGGKERDRESTRERVTKTEAETRDAHGVSRWCLSHCF